MSPILGVILLPDTVETSNYLHCTSYVDLVWTGISHEVSPETRDRW